MSEGEREFEQSVREAFDRIRAQRGSCPSGEELSAYLNGTLAEDRRLTVEAHIECCGVCDAISTRVASFEDTGASHAESIWEEGEPRIRAVVMPRAGPGWRRKLLHPVLAYAVAAVALGLVILRPEPTGLTRQPASPAWQTVKTLDLNLVRSGKPAPALGPSDEWLIIAFFVPITVGRTYTASIDGGLPQSIQSYDDRGNFHLLCDRTQFGAGPHRLIIRESETSAMFEFEFQLR
jgi:hypothetical protein